MSSEDDGEKPLPPPPPAQPEGDGKRKSSRFRRRGTALFKKAFGSKKKKVDNDFLDVDDDGLREYRVVAGGRCVLSDVRTRMRKRRRLSLSSRGLVSGRL